MDKFSLIKNNNSKKLYIGVSIIFCAVILIVGGTLAFFTQTVTGDIESIISSNDNEIFINYTDEKSMMYSDLIPLNQNDLEQALFDGDCTDDNGYNVCSGYIFTLENTYSEEQKINISMTPMGNSFTNLKYILLKLSNSGEGDVLNLTKEPIALEKNNLNEITLIENETLYLGKGNTSTYAIMFFIENKGYDQTKDDAGKSFGATIKIDSITTGKYIIKQFGEECWKTELLSDGTYKLTEFYGINNNVSDTKKYGKVNEMCSGYVIQDKTTGFYSINIPSVVGYKQISTIGNTLFPVWTVKDDVETINENYKNINNIIIDEGIKIIEDGFNDEGDNIYGAFYATGINFDTGDYITNLNVKLPSSLEIIGINSFAGSSLNNVIIPENVKEIGDWAYAYCESLSSLKFESNDKLLTIGERAFVGNNLTYSMENPLVIPSSATTIGKSAFRLNDNLLAIRFEGTLTAGNTDWYNPNVTTLNP